MVARRQFGDQTFLRVEQVFHAVGGEQRRQGTGVHLDLLAQYLTDKAARGQIGRLVRHVHGLSLRLKVFAEQFDLGRFSAAVQAFDYDEVRSCHHSSSSGAKRARPLRSTTVELACWVPWITMSSTLTWAG